MTTYALRVSESRKTTLPPLKAAVVRIDAEHRARFRELKWLFDQGTAIHKGMALIECDDPSPRFLHTVPEGFTFENAAIHDLTEVPEDFTGYPSVVVMPRLRVTAGGIQWWSTHFGIDEGVRIDTARLPWELLGL